MTVVLVGLAFWIGGWSQQVSNLALTKVRDLGIRQSLSTFVQYVVVVLGLLLTLKVIGLDLTALTVFAASVGVGIGFGLQNIVNNFISGVLLLAERPLRVKATRSRSGGETGEPDRHPLAGRAHLRPQGADHPELGRDREHLHQLDAHRRHGARGAAVSHQLPRRPEGRGGAGPACGANDQMACCPIRRHRPRCTSSARPR